MQFKYEYNSMINRPVEDIAESFKRAARCGFKYVEIPGFNDYYEKSKEIKEILEGEGLKMGSMCSVFLEGTCLSSPITRVRKKSIDYMKKTIDFASEQDCHMAIVYPGEFLKPVPLADPEDEFKYGVESMRISTEYAQKHDVTLCLEAWNRYDNHLINTLAEAVRWVKAVDMPNIGVHGDFFHMQFEEKDMYQALIDQKDYLVHIHLSDSGREAPGTGSHDFVKILQTLKDIGYDGYLALELLPPVAFFFDYMERCDGSRFQTDKYWIDGLKVLEEAEKKLV